jgi:hypothetical protein
MCKRHAMVFRGMPVLLLLAAVVALQVWQPLLAHEHATTEVLFASP